MLRRDAAHGRAVWFVLFAAVAVLITGCAAHGQDARASDKSIRVLFSGYAFDEYAALYLVAHPEASIERIRFQPPPSANDVDYLKKLLERYQAALEGQDGEPPPDIVVVDSDIYPYLARSGALVPLDAFMREYGLSAENLAPIVVQGLAVDGHVYGLTPTFASTAVVYNLDVFRRAGVAPPTDGMTWSEWADRLSALLKRAEPPLEYGLALGSGPFTTLFDLAEYMVAQSGESPFKDGEPIVATPTRQAIWSNVLTWRADRRLAPSIYESFQDPESDAPSAAMDIFGDDDFLSGRAAATIVTVYDLRRLIDLFSGENTYIDGRWEVPSFDWDVVSFPRPADGRAVGGPMWPSAIFAVNAKSSEPERAWDFLAFVLSERVAAAKQNTDLWEFLTRTEYNRRARWVGLNVAAFWQDAPAPLPSPYAPPGVLEEHYVQVEGLLRDAFEGLKSGGGDVAPVLERVQRQIDDWLRSK
ncbi:MAG: extracellular solute-binding protein [Hydrogenibacillus sp.]|nr:extracellular solute-binding protein [Hydrogenibacillus sp.]